MQEPPPTISVKVRSFAPSDAAVCRELYQEGPLGRANARNDTGLDIDDILAAYMSSPDSHFWVAETDSGEVVGMIGAQQHHPGEGEIRRLRVRRDVRRRGIGTSLLETAIRFCRDREHLKLTLDTSIERDSAIRLFEKLRFRHARTRELGDKTILYFYLDLYQGEPRLKH